MMCGKAYWGLLPHNSGSPEYPEQGKSVPERIEPLMASLYGLSVQTVIIHN